MAVRIRQAPLVSNGDGRALRRVPSPANGQSTRRLAPEKAGNYQQGEEDVSPVGQPGAPVETEIRLWDPHTHFSVLHVNSPFND